MDKIKKYFSETIKIDLIDLIVVLSYYLFSVLLFLSLSGLFNKYWISAVFLVAVFFVFVFHRRIVFSKYYLYFFIFVPLLFIGFFLFKGYFTGDALNYWLPWAREIVLQGKMPDFLLNIPSFINCRMPFLPLLFATVFVFLPFKEIFVFAVPLFFMAATALLLYQWARESGITKKYLIFVVLLFLVNPVTIKYGWDLIQEPLIIFFFTAFFYYLEKYQQSNNLFYFFLMLFSSVLAIASKFTGLFLVLPLLLIIIKDKAIRKYFWSYSVFIFLPIIFWLARNYIIYDNPMAAFFNELFRGRYYELIKAASASYALYTPSSFNNIFIRFGFIAKEFLFVFPFVLFSFYGFWKKKKIQYMFLILLFLFLTNFFFLAPGAITRYLYPVLGILVIYGLIGIEHLKSRVLSSFFFFLALLGILRTEVYSSKSYFIALFEKSLNIFFVFSQFIYEHRLAMAIVLSLFFYFLLSKKKYCSYLFLLIFCSYLVTISTIQISWLNIWLPILFLILVILTWRYLQRFEGILLRKLVIGYIVILLIINTFGLALMFFINHKQFVFPKMEAYGILPEVASQIKEIEGDNKDFYIYVAFPTYLAWYHNYKVVGPDSHTLYRVTNDLRPCNSLTAQEIYDLFQKNDIKYITENAHRSFWQDFFNTIKGRPDLFELIFEKEGYFLWKII